MNARAIKDITNFIFMQDAPAKSDIIFIPGTARSTIAEKAAELYHAGYAALVMPSGMYSTNNGRFASESIDNSRYIGEYETEYVYFKHVLMENGVPESVILCEDRATNSMENAAFSAAVLKEAGIQVNRAILCCQAFHARRAFLSYACHFPDVEILVVPTDTQGITRDGWYMQERSYRKVMAEVAKCGKYFGEFGVWGEISE